MNKTQKILWANSIWFSDIDDTLIDTAKTTPEASEGIRKVFEARFGEDQAKIIQDNFNEIFNLMLAGLRNKTDEDWEKIEGGKKAFDRLWEQIEGYQLEIKDKFGAVKKFSREVFVKIAADRANLEVSSELISEAADAYWLTLSEKTKVFPGVIELIEEIKKHKRPLYLATSSDARLRLKPNGQFEYVPRESEDFKRQRVQLLRSKGIDFNLVSIGDPEDKPHLDFFQKVIKIAEADLGHALDLSNAIMMGDSFPADLQTPKEQLGFGLVVVFHEGMEATEIVDKNHIKTGNLHEITSLISDR